MKNEDLRDLLRSLPSQDASPEFTERVLARLDETSGRRASWGGRRIVGLGAAAATVALLASGYLVDRYERSRTAERVEALRDEYRELRDDLEKLRALANELEPVLELGATNDVEFVFDLRELAEDERHGNEEKGAPGLEPVSGAPQRQE